uniref:Mediator of RNA polymerase II transcription subunit 14 n=1 Tax=Strigamia maritima TaxID=126957 RepID=T1J569_STRMM
MASSMVPIPLEGHQTPVALQSHCIGGNNSGSISLSVLVDFLLQRTYHELSVLSELLPRKTDMERKIEIVSFASRTRQLFVRLLALVKWANSASKVDKCSAIMQFLDKQSMLFIETADMLARMARETLVHARLPNFHLPCAVEVLTTGTYLRLPTCIRDRIVPADPITPLEKRSTLLRLNQIIQYRLVTSADLPAQMRSIKIEYGQVTFQVEHEFEVSLTVMSDSLTDPWRLIDINVLVEDKETGDGKPLVHPLQVHFIHQLIQSRLLDNPKPLHDLYSVLHSFCLSLQLEVLHSQVMRLRTERLTGYIAVEYSPGVSLTIFYWSNLLNRYELPDIGYKLTLQIHSYDSSKPLQIIHVPRLGSKECQQADHAFKSDQLSIEKLLVHTIYIRTKQRLHELKEEIKPKLGSVEFNIVGSPAVLHIPILQPCLRSEQLLVSIDTHKGIFLAHVPQYEPPMIQEIQQTLNGDKSKLEALIMELRYWIVLRRCEKTLQYLPVITTESLPLVDSGELTVSLSQMSKHKLFIKLCRHSNCYVIVELKEASKNPYEVHLEYHLLVTKLVPLEDEPAADTDAQRSFLSISSLVQFDAFTITHGPFTIVDVDQIDKGYGKRRLPLKMNEPPVKRSKPPAYFLPDLAHIIAMCDERLPFSSFMEELNRRNVCNQGVQVEANGACLCIKLVKMPDCDGVDKNVLENLRHSLLGCSIRMQSKGTRAWLVEYIFCHCPLVSLNSREQGARRLVYFLYDLLSADKVGKTVDDFLADWNAIAYMYQAVISYVDALSQDSGHMLSNMAEVKTYSYRRLILGYGPNKANTVTILWRSLEKKFHLVFGVVGNTESATNPHSLVALQLKQLFNQHKSLPHLIKLLHETYTPLLSINKLTTIPILAGFNSRSPQSVLDFAIVPHSPTHIRISFRNLYCLDVHFRAEGLVAIRDGAYSLFDKSKAIEEFTPIPSLKAFLNKFVDDSACQIRRRSQSEDDNPPSPVSAMDSLDSFMSGHQKPNSPADRSQEGGLRFHHPVTPPSGSNPHTPASPHMGVLSNTYSSSPAAASFPLASPPSLQGNINPSPSMHHMGTPSPGTLLTANSPSNPLHVPSPGSFLPIASPSPQVHLPSPAGAFMGHPEGGSPYPSSGLSMPSPATQQWPRSPSMPRPSPGGRNLGTVQSPGSHPALHSPQGEHKGMVMSQTLTHLSRILPQRSWAAATPTLLTHGAFDVLCTPAPILNVPPIPGMSVCSPLERFMSCVYLRRSLQRLIQNEDNLQSIPCNEPGVVIFKVENFHCRVSQNSNHLQTLYLKITPTPEHKDHWSPEEFQILERFFDNRVVCNPYKPSAMLAFVRMLTSPPRILKDFIQIMRFELFPDRNYKWQVHWCLTIPPAASAIGPVGSVGFVVAKTKFLFFLQLTRQMYAGAEPLTLVLPLVHDIMNNTTQLAERPDVTPPPPNPVIAAALKRFSEFNQNPSECTIATSVRELLSNLVIPH